MEKLSIKSGKKAFLAVALVIFMLVAFLGLAVLTSTGTFASADEVTSVSAVFSASSATAHGDSTTAKKYYNQLASGEGSFPLAVNDTFTVDYTISAATAIEAFEMYLDNAGFTVTGVTIGSQALSSETTVPYYWHDTTNGVNYTVTSGFQGASGSTLVVDVDTAAKSSFPVIHVTYKLTEAIATYSHKDIGATIEYWSDSEGDYVTLASATVGVYVRSTASITTTSPAKTYDATAASTTPTFTPAVSDTGNESNRAAIVTEWKPDEGSYSSTAPIDAGDYNVKVSTVANDYYEATSYNADFTIAKKAITITADDKTSVYSTSPVALSYSYAPIDFYGRDSITVSYSGAGASVTTATVVGEYTITPSASGTGIGNYTVTPVNGTYTVTRHHVAVPTVTIYNDGATTGTTITAGTTEEKTFNGKEYSFNYTVDPTDANSNSMYTTTGGSAITAVGSSTLTLTIGSNYYWGAEGVAVGSQDTANKTFTIQVNKANITVYLHHAAITYRDAVPTTGYTLGDDDNGLLYGEDLSEISLTQGDFSTAYTVGSPVGAYDIAVAAASASRTAIETYLSNYNVSYDGEDQLSVGKLTVNAAASWIDWATGDSASMTYDKSAHGIVAVPASYTMSHAETSAVICNVVLSGGDNSNGTQTHVSGNEAAVTLTATFSLKTETNDDYGNLITANYDLGTSVQTKDITITRKAVTITAADKETTYGSAAPAFTSDAGSILISGDTYTTEGSMTCAYTATAGNANRVVGTYDIIPAGWVNNDYAISYENGTLTVNKKVVTFTWSATQTWVYDAGSHTITATVVGAEYGETITVASYSGDASAINVGDYSRTVTSLSDDDNYAITTAGTQTETYSITQAPVTVTITPATSLVYTSASKTVFTVTVSGMIGSETLTYTFDGTNITEADGTFTLNDSGSQTFTGLLAQDYALELTAVANGTGLVANYDVTLPDEAENTIEKATFTPGAITYDGDEVSWAAVTGVQGSDVITFTYTVNKGATQKQSSTSVMSYTASQTGDDYVLAISFAGDRAANYNAIADQALLEVFSVSLTDDLANHPNEGPAFATITLYAFDGETVPEQTAWELSGYTFEGWYINEDEINFNNAITSTLVYEAVWTVKTFDVTYYYRLSGDDEWTQYGEVIETTFYTALESLPTKVWFANSGWHINAIGGAVKTILDNAADTAFYTEYSYDLGNGDINGDGSINTTDATILRQHLAGGYTLTFLDSIEAAWAISDAGSTGAATYVLGPSANVDGDARVFANDVTVINKAIATGYGYVISEGAIVKSLTANDSAYAIGTGYTISAVTVDGAAVEYTYTSGTLTLTTPLTSGQTVVIKTTRESVTSTRPNRTYSDTSLLWTYTKA